MKAGQLVVSLSLGTVAEPSAVALWWADDLTWGTYARPVRKPRITT